MLYSPMFTALILVYLIRPPWIGRVPIHESIAGAAEGTAATDTTENPEKQKDTTGKLPPADRDEAGVMPSEDQQGGSRDAVKQASPAQQSQQTSQPSEVQKILRDTNPLRSLGNAHEQWRRQFEVVQESTEQQKPAAANDSVACEQYEFARGEDHMSTEQVLASATTEQAEDQRAHADGVLQEEEPPMATVGPERENVPCGDQVRSDEAAAVAPGSSADKPAPTTEKEAVQAIHEVDDGATKPTDAHGFSPALQQEGPETEMADRPHGETDRDITQTIDAEGVDMSRGFQLLQKCTAATALLTGELVEQLRLVVEPTLASRLSGDFKTGKRLNMKKVIAYIASNFRRDRIWMRRTTPDKRDYQVLLAIDETKSMKVNSLYLFCAMQTLPAPGFDCIRVSHGVCVFRRISVLGMRFKH